MLKIFYYRRTQVLIWFFWNCKKWKIKSGLWSTAVFSERPLFNEKSIHHTWVTVIFENSAKNRKKRCSTRLQKRISDFDHGKNPQYSWIQPYEKIKYTCIMIPSRVFTVIATPVTGQCPLKIGLLGRND